MATKTDFLGLILPANNEYNNTWDAPINDNFTKLDQELESQSNEVQAARFSKTSLAEFLAVSHFNDGTLKPSEEIDDARNSSVYGDDDGSGTDFVLVDRLEKADREVWDSREGLAGLQQSLARRARDFSYPDAVIDGPKTSTGQPNFLTGSGSEFQINGDPSQVVFNIDGYWMRERTDADVPVTGGDGTRYLYAQRPVPPSVILDRSTNIAGTTAGNPLNNNKVQIFKDTGINFITSGIKVGDILEILNSDNVGEYIITEVGFDSNADEIRVIGRFVNGLTALNYVIKDPLKPTYGVDTTFLLTPGKCYIGQGEYTAGSLTDVVSYNFKGKFRSPYVAVDVSSLPTFEQVFNHNLGEIPTKIQIFASQANDDTQPVEPLSLAVLGEDIAFAISNTLVLTPAVFNPGSTDASYTPGSLTGNVTSSKTGGVFNLRSVLVKITKTQIFVKNARDNHFYRDYNGTDLTSGFLKVVCEK